MREVKPGIIGDKPWSVRSEQCGIIKVSFSRHDRVCTCRFEATIDVRVIEDITIGEYRYGDGLLDCSDLIPVGESLCRKSDSTKDELWMTGRTHSVVSPLFPDATMAGEDLCASSLEHLGVFNRLFNSREDPELCCHGDEQILMQCVYCGVRGEEGGKRSR